MPAINLDNPAACVAAIKLNARLYNGGIINMIDLEFLASHDPWFIVLIRYSRGEIRCPARDAKHFIDLITRDRGDSVRDISILNK